MTTTTISSLGRMYLDQPNFFGSKGSWMFNRFVSTVVKDKSITPNYRSVIRSKGKLFTPLPYKHTEVTFRAGKGFYQDQSRRLPKGDWQNTWNLVGFGIAHDTGLVSPAHAPEQSVDSHVSSQLSQTRNLAIITALGRVKSQDINVAQAFAERKMTMKTVGDAAIKIARMYRELRRGDLKSAAFELGLTVSRRGSARYRRQHEIITRGDEYEVGKVLSNGVLQLQYGWKPLLNDVFGAMDKLESMQQAGYPVKTMKVMKTLPINRVTKRYEGSSLVTATRTGHVSTTVNLAWTMTDPNLALANSLGLTNPATIAWELMPWSFVIDWFIPIGNYINCLDATNGLKFLSGSISTKVDVSLLTQITWDGAVRTDPWGNFSYRQLGYNLYSRTERTFERTILSSFPGPSFPAFKNPLSLEHAINAIALLRGLKR